MLLEMRTPKEKKTKKKSKSQLCQRRYPIVTFGEKVEIKQSQTKSNFVKGEEN